MSNSTGTVTVAGPREGTASIGSIRCHRLESQVPATVPESNGLSTTGGLAAVCDSVEKVDEGESDMGIPSAMTSAWWPLRDHWRSVRNCITLRESSTLPLMGQ
mmetsp:Transcript_29146/g.33679  ORF Transcript_29146/g.33679 Transcript_29146/m.33679 type:complete len:103 (+) Transcript_29146:476-784(+)